jgi:hypothetical protein
MLAKTMLMVKGVNVANPGNTVTLPPPVKCESCLLSYTVCLSFVWPFR